MPSASPPSPSLLEQKTLDHPFLGAPDPSWRDAALCRDAVNVDFFPFSENSQAVRRAKEVCTRCPVTDDCLAYAMRTRQSEGVWGALTAAERVSLRRRWGDQTRVISELKSSG